MARSAIALLLVLVSPGVALAGVPGRWDRVGPAVADGDQAGLVRTLDGRVHVAWVAPALGGTSLRETVVGRTGALGRTVDIVTSWRAVSPATLLLGVDGGGLETYFAGDDGAGAHGVFRASASSDGSGWTVRAERLSDAAWPVAARGVVAASLGIGGDQVVATWAGADGCPLIVDPAGTEVLGPPCGAVESAVAVDFARGVPVAAWTSEAPATSGLWYLVFDGLGPPHRVPGSGGVDAVGRPAVVAPAQPTAISGRPGFGGVFIGFPAGWPATTSVAVYRVGNDRATVLASGPGTTRSHVALAADPDGRLWAVWSAVRGTHRTLVARRSNAGVTAWGAPVTVALPAGLDAVGTVAANAIETSLDVVLNGSGAQRPRAYWHTRALPGITVSGVPARSRRGRIVLRLRLADAGRPLRRVLVRCGPVRGRTDARGRVTLRVVRRTAGTLAVTATADGYARATALMRVR